MLRRIPSLGLAIFLIAIAVPVFAESGQDRLQSSASVLHDILNVPDGIPLSLLNKAECVVVIPSVKKLAFGVGGSYGRGAMVCRGGNNHTGPWGAPAMYALEGGSFGFQIGGQATDVVFLIMNSEGVNSLLKSKVKLGADASAAAGPIGRATSAETDALMHTEILSYARSRGLFAGISLEGSTLRPDADTNQELYGRSISGREIIEGKVHMPEAAKPLVSELMKASPRHL